MKHCIKLYLKETNNWPVVSQEIRCYKPFRNTDLKAGPSETLEVFMKVTALSDSTPNTSVPPGAGWKLCPRGLYPGVVRFHPNSMELLRMEQIACFALSPL